MDIEKTINHIIKNSKHIAIIGLSPDISKPSHRVAKFLQEKGHKIYPIYPKENIILNEKVYRNLSDINDKIDTLILFRKGEYAMQILPDLIKMNIPNLWLQLGITNNVVAKECEKLSINFIQDRCIMLEYPL